MWHHLSSLLLIILCLSSAFLSAAEKHGHPREPRIWVELATLLLYDADPHSEEPYQRVEIE